jgi:hypothetical protein
MRTRCGSRSSQRKLTFLRWSRELLELFAPEMDFIAIAEGFGVPASRTHR